MTSPTPTTADRLTVTLELTDDMLDQFEQLKQLLFCCRSLNTANNIIDNLEHAIAASNLQLVSWRTGQEGFVAMLDRLIQAAIRDGGTP